MSPRKKIPTKTELLQLQKLYRTDEKIGERLGGVPAYLVAYWRRKKGVPKYSLPKFSENEIRTLWERYGDDDKCGLELGISKAAFYNWRRRYGIREKPAFLKLEQLELNFPGLRSSTGSITLFGEQTVAQKILARLASAQKAEIGQQIEIEPNLIVCNSDTSDVIDAFKALGNGYVKNPNRIAFSLALPDDINGNQAATNQTIREFARRQTIKSVFEFAQGSCHQVLVESGMIKPGELITGCEAGLHGYGSVSALAVSHSAEVVANSWASGTLTMEVPPSIRIDVNGRRVRSVMAKDVALYVSSQIKKEDSENRIVEYHGTLISQSSMSERFTLAGMAHTLKARGAICHFDSTIRRYLTNRNNSQYAPVVADKDAIYDGLYQMNIDHLPPQIAGPNSFESIRAVSELEDTHIDQVVLGTCASGRFDDLRIGAEIIKGKKISKNCRLLVVPGSTAVYLEAVKKGLIRAYIEAGAIIMYPGYGHSPQAILNLLAPGEKCLATIGNMPELSTEEQIQNEANPPEIFICSPATAAASALTGSITDPTRYLS
ncbi:MAG: aconitase family protein [bacterium]|nr:aconitase family protein [bacterium]